jgi:predicted GIY-YIG superfamily endonuclease
MKGVVYKISSSAGLPYIGSTIQSLKKRLSRHYEKRKCMSRIHINKPDLEIIILETIETDDINDIRMRERKWIESIKCCNIVKRPYITDEERLNGRDGYRISDKPKEYDRQYEKTRLLRKLPFFNSNDLGII